MKYFVKDIADQVQLDVYPSGRLLHFDGVHVVDSGKREIQVYLQGYINMDDEQVTIDNSAYTFDMDAEEDSVGDWSSFDDSEVIFLEKHLQY